MNEQRSAELSSLGIQSSNLLIITKEALLVRGSMSKLGCRYRQHPLTQPNILGAQGSGYRPTTQGQHRERRTRLTVVSWYHHTELPGQILQIRIPFLLLARTIASFHPGIRLEVLLAITAGWLKGWLKSERGPGAIGQQVRETVFSPGRPPPAPHMSTLKLGDTKAVSWLPVGICFRQDS